MKISKTKHLKILSRSPGRPHFIVGNSDTHLVPRSHISSGRWWWPRVCPLRKVCANTPCFWIWHACPKVSKTCTFCPHSEGQQGIQCLTYFVKGDFLSFTSRVFACLYDTPPPFRKDKRWLTLKTSIGKISKIQKEKWGQKKGSTLTILMWGLNPFALREH